MKNLAEGKPGHCDAGRDRRAGDGRRTQRRGWKADSEKGSAKPISQSPTAHTVTLRDGCTHTYRKGN